MLGPVTWLSLGKSKDDGFDPLDHLEAVLDIYAGLLADLAGAGADWVQIDEPILVLDLSPAQQDALRRTYARLAQAGPQVMLASYFGALGDNRTLALSLPVAGLHLDLVRAPEQIDAVLEASRTVSSMVRIGLFDSKSRR